MFKNKSNTSSKYHVDYKSKSIRALKLQGPLFYSNGLQIFSLRTCHSTAQVNIPLPRERNKVIRYQVQGRIISSVGHWNFLLFQPESLAKIEGGFKLLTLSKLMERM